MHLKRLKVKDFRNYADLDIVFGGRNSFLFGDNAQGKSNLLEAIYFLAMLNSCRTTKGEEVVRWDTNGFYLCAEIERGGLDQLAEISFTGGKKTFRINSKRRHRFPSLEEGVKVVLFLPDDPQLIMGIPRARRRFLNLEISQIDPAYRHYLQRYQGILSQRNALLRKARWGRASAQGLAPWDEQLINSGAQIVKRRAAAVSTLSRLAADVHKRLTRNREALVLSYVPSFRTDQKIEENFRAALERRREKELSVGMTLVGPHRDGLGVSANGIDISRFGSRAQKRTAALSVRLGLVEMIRQIVGESPVVLLDDVLSELDSDRTEALLDFLAGRDAQCIITSTDASHVGKDLRDVELFRISGAAVNRISAPL